MKKYKIYGTPYVIMPTTKEPADSYAYRGKLVDDIPKGKVIGGLQEVSDRGHTCAAIVINTCRRWLPCVPTGSTT